MTHPTVIRSALFAADCRPTTMYDIYLLYLQCHTHVPWSYIIILEIRICRDSLAHENEGQFEASEREMAKAHHDRRQSKTNSQTNGQKSWSEVSGAIPLRINLRWISQPSSRKASRQANSLAVQ